MSEDITFGKWLRQRRRILDLSQRAFADQVGCARITLSRIEADTLKPSQQLALIILEKVGIPQMEREQWVRFARGLSGLPSKDIQSTVSVRPQTNLPASLSSFIGREKEQAEIIKLITKHRLITFTGSGGVGKTRLSLKIGERVLGDYEDGVWLVELAALHDPTLLPQAISTAFGITMQSNIFPLELLINFLRTKTLLLLLDNCEHLLDACAQLTDTLLKSCPHLKVLATSREALGILGEATYRVPSLELPDVQELLEKFRDYESVRLFEERAQLAQTDFALTMENAPAIAQICSRLDGIPLAIELAAARVDMFSTEQIVARLNESFNLLTGGSRTALPRQQTIRASIDWSWNLLPNSERALLRRLSVFSSGWTLEAAESVCDSHPIMDLMTRLVAKSLVMMNQASGGHRRFHLHEIIRQYAHEKLLESGEEINIRSQHLMYFLQLSEQSEIAWLGPEQVEWYSRLDNERDNLRAALKWAAQSEKVEDGMLIYSALKNLWLGWSLSEGIRWGVELLRKPQSHEYPRARAKALYLYGMLLWRVEQFENAYVAGEECLTLSRTCGDQHIEVNGWLLLAWVMIYQRKLEQGMGFAQRALALSQSIKDIWGQARALSCMGWCERDHDLIRAYWNEAEEFTRQLCNWYGLAEHLGDRGNFELLDGNLETAQRKLDEAFAINKRLNNRKRMGIANQAYGRIALIQGDFRQARARFQENLVTAKERGSRANYLWSYCFLAYVDLREGNLIAARDTFIECLHEFQKDKSLLGIVFTIEGISSLLTKIESLERAARLMGWADRTRQETDNPRPIIEQMDAGKLIADCLAKIGEVAFSAAYEEGKKMTLDEAIAYTLEVS